MIPVTLAPYAIAFALGNTLAMDIESPEAQELGETSSYHDGSIGEHVIGGEYVSGAHQRTFTQEEKLAVTAKPQGSIKREGRARSVFGDET